MIQVGKYYPPSVGGMEVLVQAVARKLSARPGIDVQVLVSNEGGPTVTEQDGRVSVTRLRRRANVRGAPFTPGFLRRFRGIDRGAIVHIHSPNPPAEMAWLLARPHAALVASAWGQIHRQKVLRFFWEPVYRAYFARCAALAMPSLAYAQTYDVLREATARFKQVPVGLEPDRVAMTPSVREKVEALRAEHPKGLVLFVGRLVTFKGAETLVRASPHFESDALIVGDGPLRNHLEAVARECGVADRVSFVGTLRGDDMVAAYHAADIYAQTSINASEAYSGSLIEAGFCGRAVVTTEIGSGTSEVNLDGQTGLVVPPADPGALAQAVRTLEEDSALRARYGAALKERVLANHTLDRMVESLEACYRDVAARRGK